MVERVLWLWAGRGALGVLAGQAPGANALEEFLIEAGVQGQIQLPSAL